MANALLAPDTYMLGEAQCWSGSMWQASSEGAQAPQGAFALEHKVSSFYPTLHRNVKSNLTR